MGEGRWLTVARVERGPAPPVSAAAAGGAEAAAGAPQKQQPRTVVRYRGRLENVPVKLIGLPPLEEYVVEPHNIYAIHNTVEERNAASRQAAGCHVAGVCMCCNYGS